jgi:hypothetical protein
MDNAALRYPTLIGAGCALPRQLAHTGNAGHKGTVLADEINPEVA